MPAAIDPTTGLPLADPALAGVGGIDPTTGLPLNAGPIDPATGLPLNAGPIDPVTGLPVDGGGIDPVTGLPLQSPAVVDPGSLAGPTDPGLPPAPFIDSSLTTVGKELPAPTVDPGALAGGWPGASGWCMWGRACTRA